MHEREAVLFSITDPLASATFMLWMEDGYVDVDILNGFTINEYTYGSLRGWECINKYGDTWRMLEGAGYIDYNGTIFFPWRGWPSNGMNIEAMYLCSVIDGSGREIYENPKYKIESVNDIAPDQTNAEYYNLKGQSVTPDTKGITIKCQSGQATKELHNSK